MHLVSMVCDSILCLKLCILSDEDFLLIYPLGMLPFERHLPLTSISLLKWTSGKVYVMNKIENAFAHQHFL